MDRRTFTFGKYKGEAVVSVIEKDPDYVLWAVRNIDFFDLQGEEYLRLSGAFYEKRQRMEKEIPVDTNAPTLEEMEEYDRLFDRYEQE